MADSITTNYGWAYPTVNADADTWGTTLNNAIIAIDGQTHANAVNALQKSSNLNDLTNMGTARTNLGLGDAATHPASDFQTAGLAALKANNLSDLPNPSSARGFLGLGSAAVKNITVSAAAPTGGVDGDIWVQ